MEERIATVPINIEEEMKVAYMDYAMSVIIGRALPDVRDGLKPVHRRILFAMHELGNTWNRAYKKSARVVGDVIGKYHPHGDTAVYDSIVRMAQDFSLRALLVDGQGNFGSVDGDSAAAMRYTEIRMTRLAQELLEDLEKETVDFGANYDDTLQEPLLMPAKFPNLLVNGSSGIAVGMASNIPPHNLGEIIDGLMLLIDDPEIDVTSLAQVIKGPDFPTAGFIYGRIGIDSAFRTGRGSIKMRARTNIEVGKNDRESIIVTELPYQVNKARLIEKIAALVREKKIEGITDLRDESDRTGMRVVITLKKNENNEVILNQLFKHTQMQETFGANMLSLVNNQPKILGIKEMLQYFVHHRLVVVTRRTIFELRKAEERRHILDGLKIALDDIDRVIKIIRGSKSPEEARSGLIEALSLDEIQAKAILDMRLQRLTGLERQKILDELAELVKSIERFNTILADDGEKYKIIKTELTEIKERYADPRRTEIVQDDGEFDIEDLIAEEDMVVTVSHNGYIKRNPVTLYRSQRRGGTGSRAMSMREEDFAEGIFVASTHDYVMFFSNIGKVHWKKVYQIPEATRIAKGKALAGLLDLQEGEKINATVCVKEFLENQSLIMATERGVIKKTPLSAFSKPRAGGIISINLDEGDKLIGVQRSDGEHNIFLGTRKGQAILFPESDIRDLGRSTRGVRGISLDEDDIVVGMEVAEPEMKILTVSENGYGKRTIIENYRLQRRAGKGIINLKVNEKVGLVAGIKSVVEEDDLIVVTSDGTLIRMKVREISVIGRNTQGVRIIDTKKARKVIAIATLSEEATEEPSSEEPSTEETSAEETSAEETSSDSPVEDQAPPEE